MVKGFALLGVQKEHAGSSVYDQAALRVLEADRLLSWREWLTGCNGIVPQLVGGDGMGFNRGLEVQQRPSDTAIRPVAERLNLVRKPASLGIG